MNATYVKMCLVGVLALLLLACSSTGKKYDPYEGKSAQQIYHSGHLAMQHGDYETAINEFQALESHFPFGDYTRQGQLDLIYAHYKFEEQSAAVLAADRFIRLHPRFPDLDYVYFMKGVAKFNENAGLLERLAPVEPTKRDISNEYQAFINFAKFLRRFPDSRYAPDARRRMIYLRNSLAKHELFIANYYMARGAYLSAAARALVVVKQFDESTAMPKALRVLASAYTKLGLTELANDTQAVLALNYTDSV